MVLLHCRGPDYSGSRLTIFPVGNGPRTLVAARKDGVSSERVWNGSPSATLFDLRTQLALYILRIFQVVTTTEVLLGNSSLCSAVMTR